MTWRPLAPDEMPGLDGLLASSLCTSGPVTGAVLGAPAEVAYADRTEVVVGLWGGPLPEARLRLPGRTAALGVVRGGVVTVGGVQGTVRGAGRGLSRRGRAVRAELAGRPLVLRRRGLTRVVVERPDGSAVLTGAGPRYRLELSEAADPGEQALALLLWFGVGPSVVSLV